MLWSSMLDFILNFMLRMESPAVVDTIHPQNLSYRFCYRCSDSKCYDSPTDSMLCLLIHHQTKHAMLKYYITTNIPSDYIGRHEIFKILHDYLSNIINYYNFAYSLLHELTVLTDSTELNQEF